VDEIEARFDLLKSEREAIQAGIRNYDVLSFQIKGWCITIATAGSGVAISSHDRALVSVGLAATVCFYLVDAYFRSLQGVFIDRDDFIEAQLKRTSVEGALSDRDALHIPWLSHSFRLDPRLNWAGQTLKEMQLLAVKAKDLITFGLYLLLVLLQIVLLIVL
jgi:hypothetical protein